MINESCNVTAKEIDALVENIFITCIEARERRESDLLKQAFFNAIGSYLRHSLNLSLDVINTFNKQSKHYSDARELLCELDNILKLASAKHTLSGKEKQFFQFSENLDKLSRLQNLCRSLKEVL